VEDELSNKVALTVAAGEVPDECNKAEIGTIVVVEVEKVSGQ